MANVETGALIVTGVALVVTVILWATEPRANAASAKVAFMAGGPGVVW